MSGDYEQAKLRAWQSEGAYVTMRPLASSWEQRKFSELYVVNNERNESCEFGYDKTLSVATMTYNGGNGAADNSLSTYKVVRVGDIAFEGHTNKEHAYGRFVLNDAGDGLMSPRFSCLRPIVEQRYSFWKHYIPRESMMRPVLVNATKSGTMMNELVPADLMRESILVPVLYEQEAIGRFFKQLDDLITLHQRKCQHCSLGGYLSWEQRKLGEFSKKITTKNADGGLSETFTNSAEQGVISQLDYFDHDITNDANISGYYIVQPDNFVYNPRISVTAPCGPINRNRLNRAGVMSPLYTVFSVDGSMDKTYLEHYFKTSRWHDFMFLEGNSGARSDRFSISDAMFFEMPIWCPKIPEQRAIAKQLETMDSLITLHR